MKETVIKKKIQASR